MQPLRRRIGPLSRSISRSSPLLAFVFRPCPSRIKRTFSVSGPHSFPFYSGFAPLPSRKLISVSGPEAAKFLQGVVTANLLSSPAKEAPARTDVPGYYAAFLTAQGRILHDVFLYLDQLSGPQPGESFLIECDADEAANLAKHIKRYKLRAKFNVRLVDPEEISVWQAWGSSSRPPSSISEGLLLEDGRAPGMGWRVLVFGDRIQKPGVLEEKLGVEKADEKNYTLHRYLLGVPEGQKEIIRDAALPHETNLDVMGAVDFRKGCYVGQELTIRTEHRGVVRKRVLPVSLYDGKSPAPERLEFSEKGVVAEKVVPGASIGRVGKRGRSAGKWLNGIGNIGLAVCRLETMTDIVLPGESSTGGGFTTGDEFEVATGTGEEGGETGEKVRIKAFVPDWLRERLSLKGHYE